MFNVVLYEPEIPQNTGNIARLCAATGCNLYLIGPLGFSLQDRYLKRAGLDYWHLVNVTYCDSFQELCELYPQATFYFVSTKGRRYYTDVEYQKGDFLVFGSETRGLPQELLEKNQDACLRIPMVSQARCLNLSNAVAIVVYEALRKQGFSGLS
ncbi:MAG: tRNA (uridine(34)/cytosine(34)/5-carboxymethylaminomethyluridine(34)-2'-O)-methyltransferase TrmL [Thermacetogeniaceae bacterium]